MDICHTIHARRISMGQIRTRKDIEAGLAELLRLDARLIALAEQVDEVPLRLARPGFRGLADIIISQQVSKASAAAISGRLMALVDPFTPQNYLQAGEPAWIEAGLSRPKQRTFLELCGALNTGRLDLDAVCDLPVEQAMERLVSIRGIGTWTAEVYLLFCAGHGDILPAGDLALQEAARVMLAEDRRPDEKRMREIARDWSPHRGVAARLLWAYYAVLKDGRDILPV